MTVTPNPKPTTVEEVFNDFKGRRAGIIRALTVDLKEFYRQCDPKRENLCLYGHPNETWELKLPVEKLPPEVPEPAVGINFARDVILNKEWLSFVAVHSDSWLHSVAFYFGGRLRFGQSDRMRLFEMINDYPTVFEEFIEQMKKLAATHNNGSKSKSQQPEPSASKEEEDKQVIWLCGACGEKYVNDEFWIECYTCKEWYHGDCVKITLAKFKQIEQYKCPTCSKKKFRPQHAKKSNRK